MKKLLLGALLLLSTSFISCTNKPEINYTAKNYVESRDWKSDIIKTDTLFSVSKRIVLHEKTFVNCKDSVNFEIRSFKKSEIGYLPTDLNMTLYDAMLDCKYVCSNPATFKVTGISVYKIEDENVLTINIEFLASNAYGTPGELNGYFTYDLKTHKLKNKLIG